MSVTESPAILVERLPEGLLRSILAHLNPRRVIVFGSQATGNTHRDSDWDLLVVVDDDIPKERLHWRAMHDVRRGINAAIDMIAIRESRFRDQEDVVGTLSWKALNNGVTVYERAD